MNEADAGVSILQLYDIYNRAAELKAFKVTNVIILQEDDGRRPCKWRAC